MPRSMPKDLWKLANKPRPKTEAELLNRYGNEIKQLAITTKQAINRQALTNDHRYHAKLYRTIFSIYGSVVISPTNDLEDIEQEIGKIWVQAFRYYHREGRKDSVRKYMFRKTLREMKVWANQQIRPNRYVDKNPDTYEMIPENMFPHFSGLKLNFDFIRNGSGIEIFSRLSNWERYLLYLYFGQEKSYKDIGEIIGRSSRLTFDLVTDVLIKLRRIING